MDRDRVGGVLGHGVLALGVAGLPGWYHTVFLDLQERDEVGVF